MVPDPFRIPGMAVIATLARLLPTICNDNLPCNLAQQELRQDGKE